MNISIERIQVVYRDSKGGYHEQLLSDIIDSGTLIDPETGDDMEFDHAVVEL